jgi:predicted membrane GTPase involved in stress response
MEDSSKSEYPRVRVTDAPGYADFDGELIMNVMSADDRPLSVVGFEWEGKREVALLPRTCVTVLDGGE